MIPMCLPCYVGDPKKKLKIITILSPQWMWRVEDGSNDIRQVSRRLMSAFAGHLFSSDRYISESVDRFFPNLQGVERVYWFARQFLGFRFSRRTLTWSLMCRSNFARVYIWVSHKRLARVWSDCHFFARFKIDKLIPQNAFQQNLYYPLLKDQALQRMRNNIITTAYVPWDFTVKTIFLL